MPTNKDLIRMHLESYLHEHWNDGWTPSWATVLSYCNGYYGEITLDMVSVVRQLQLLGKIE